MPRCWALTTGLFAVLMILAAGAGDAPAEHVQVASEQGNEATCADPETIHELEQAQRVAEAKADQATAELEAARTAGKASENEIKALRAEQDRLVQVAEDAKAAVAQRERELTSRLEELTHSLSSNREELESAEETLQTTRETVASLEADVAAARSALQTAEESAASESREKQTLQKHVSELEQQLKQEALNLQADRASVAAATERAKELERQLTKQAQESARKVAQLKAELDAANSHVLMQTVQHLENLLAYSGEELDKASRTFDKKIDEASAAASQVLDEAISKFEKAPALKRMTHRADPYVKKAVAFLTEFAKFARTDIPALRLKVEAMVNSVPVFAPHASSFAELTAHVPILFPCTAAFAVWMSSTISRHGFDSLSRRLFLYITVFWLLLSLASRLAGYPNATAMLQTALGGSGSLLVHLDVLALYVISCLAAVFSLRTRFLGGLLQFVLVAYVLQSYHAAVIEPLLTNATQELASSVLRWHIAKSVVVTIVSFLVVSLARRPTGASLPEDIPSRYIAKSGRVTRRN